MKLNHDCVRDLLLEIEEKHIVDQLIHLSDFETFQVVKTYGLNECLYALQKLRENSLVIFHKSQDPQGYYLEFWIGGLAWDGHSYLDNIRSSSRWKKMKKHLSKAGSEVALPIAIDLATSLARKSVGLD